MIIDREDADCNFNWSMNIDSKRAWSGMCELSAGCKAIWQIMKRTYGRKD